MKKLIYLLLLLPAIVLSQNKFEVVPIVSTTAIVCSTKSGSDTLRYTTAAENGMCDTVTTVVGSDTIIFAYTDNFLATDSITVGWTLRNDSLFDGGYATIETVIDSMTFIVDDTAKKVLAAGDTLWYREHGGFYHVTSGDRIQGTGIPWGTTVTIIDSCTLDMSNNATASGSSVSVRFPYFTSLAYGAGDALGFSFKIGSPRKINNVYVVDDDDQLTSAFIVFLDSVFTETADNSAWAISDTDNDNVVGYYTIATAANWSVNNLTTMATTTLPIYLPPATQIYAQLIANSTPTFTKVNPLKVIIIYDGN